jgi:hypothetical protein
MHLSFRGGVVDGVLFMAMGRKNGMKKEKRGGKGGGGKIHL